MAQECAPETTLRLVFSCLVLVALFGCVASAQTTASSQPPVFLPPLAYESGGDTSFSVAIGDLNGDGKPDLVVANRCATSGDCRSGMVGVLLGNGDGTFQPAVSYRSGGQYALAVAVADVTGDGKLDVITANQCVSPRYCFNGSVGVLIGNGDGSFVGVWSYPSGGWYADSVAVGDVNGDGYADLVVGNLCISAGHCGNGTVGVLLGNGQGNFQRAVYGSGGKSVRALALGDVNGDGAPDVLFANEGPVSVLLGNGDGTFQTAVSYASGGGGLRSIAVADVSGDGKPDLLVASSCRGVSDCSSGGVGVLLGNGDGTFQPGVTYSSGALYGRGVAVGDVNVDGYPDVVVASQFGPTDETRALAIGVLLGNGDGTFQPAISLDSGAHWPRAVAVGDVNKDGKPDIIVANDFGDNGRLVGVLVNDTPFCTVPPSITVSATPIFLWPANGGMVPVDVFGTITSAGCTLTTAGFVVADEYGKIQPSGLIAPAVDGVYSFTVLLQASRSGADVNGRVYNISVNAANNSARTASETVTIIVPHDQRH